MTAELNCIKAFIPLLSLIFISHYYKLNINLLQRLPIQITKENYNFIVHNDAELINLDTEVRKIKVEVSKKLFLYIHLLKEISH